MHLTRIVMISCALVLASVSSSCWQGASSGNSSRSGGWENLSEAGQNRNARIERANSDNKEKAKQSVSESDGFWGNLPEGFAIPDDEIGRKLLGEYGSVFIAQGGVKPPPTIIFRDEVEVSAFQNSLSISSETIGGVTIELQTEAMDALLLAIAEARSVGLSITPRGRDAARRSYSGTIQLWKSRIEPGLDHWLRNGAISSPEAAQIRSLSPFEQVPEVLRLESRGLFFSKDLSKSVIYSVAPPGTSQHLSMLALDVNEHDQAGIRSILAKHGWHQTVVSDLPHFTFIGLSQSELYRVGLTSRTEGGRIYWVPKL